MRPAAFNLQWSKERGFSGRNALILPFAALLAWLYIPVVADLASHWYRDPNYSHGFLIPLVSGYLLWRRREDLRASEAEPWAWGIVLLVAGLVMYVGGTVGAAHTTLRLSMIVVIGGAVIFVCGRQIFRIVSMPLSYLLFMVPLPAYLYDAISFPLKVFVAKSSVLIMQAFDMTVYRDGNIIALPEITIEIADACSGMRSLYSLLAFAVGFSALFMRRSWMKVALVLFVIPIAVFANLTRVIVTAVLARHYGAVVTNEIVHDSAGLGVFLLSTVMVTVIGIALVKTGKEEDT